LLFFLRSRFAEFRPSVVKFGLVFLFVSPLLKPFYGTTNSLFIPSSMYVPPLANFELPFFFFSRPQVSSAIPCPVFDTASFSLSPLFPHNELTSVFQSFPPSRCCSQKSIPGYFLLPPRYLFFFLALFRFWCFFFPHCFCLEGTGWLIPLLSGNPLGAFFFSFPPGVFNGGDPSVSPSVFFLWACCYPLPSVTQPPSFLTCRFFPPPPWTGRFFGGRICPQGFWSLTMSATRCFFFRDPL